MLKGVGTMMYPVLLDHDSPFSLGTDRDSLEVRASALSYGLVGNESLHIYFVVARSLIVRIPVAWFDADAPVP